MEEAWTIAMWTKTLPALTVTLITLFIGWYFGHRITSYWESIKKRGSEEIETSERFYVLYGEFYSVWKLWSIHKGTGRYLLDHERDPKTTWSLLERASSIEAGFESILVRLTQERKLSDEDIDTLARFREGVQCLRESIRKDRTLDWKANPAAGVPADKYLAFKILANRVSGMLSNETRSMLSRPERPARDAAENSLVKATRVDHRGDWWVLPSAPATALPALERTGAGRRLGG